MKYNYEHLVERFYDEYNRAMENEDFKEKCLDGLWGMVSFFYFRIAKKIITYYTIGLEIIGFLALIIGRYVFHSSIIQIMSICYLALITLCSLFFEKKLSQKLFLSMSAKNNYENIVTTACFLQYLKEYQSIDISEISGVESTAFGELDRKSNHFNLR